MIPLLCDLEGDTVLVFGGGTVGARRARRLAREARVVVLSPSFADESFGGARLVRAAPGPSDAGPWIDRVGPAMVVAAADDADLNAAVAAAARERGVTYNRADTGGAAEGEVVIPAIAREDPVVVGVGTGGASPAVSRWLRREIEPLVEEAGAVARVAADVGEELRDRGVTGADRRDALRAVVEDEAVRRAATAEPRRARERAWSVATAALGDGER